MKPWKVILLILLGATGFLSYWYAGACVLIYVFTGEIMSIGWFLFGVFCIFAFFGFLVGSEEKTNTRGMIESYRPIPLVTSRVKL